MSGHSKWHSIKRQKAANDHARGKVFSRHAREILVAARLGGGDPDLNPRLRLAVQRAKSDSMPNDNIERAIKKGTGELEGGQLEEQVYEGYAPGGVALMIDCLTDNKNRTVGELRAIFNKHGGGLGEAGCVAYQFETKGVINLAGEGLDEDAVIEAALEAGADDVETSSDGYEIHCEPGQLEAVVNGLKAAGFESDDYEVSRIPNVTVPLDEAAARKILRIIDLLEDLEDVQKVHANFDVDEDVLQAVSAEG